MEQIKQELKYRLADGVYYTRFQNWVYLRDVNAKHDYNLNLSAGDILDCFGSKETLEGAIKNLRQKFTVSDEAQFLLSVSTFVRNMVEKGILVVSSGFEGYKDGDDIPSRIQADSAKLGRLWSACLEITYRCNEKCLHCYLDDPAEAHEDGELKWEEYEKIIPALHNLGAMSVLVTGGEPTLRRDVFMNICRCVVSNGMMLNVYTNALKLDEDMAYALAGLRPNSVSCSLYGCASFHDSITGVKGSFERTWMNVVMLKAMGVDTYVKTVLFRGHLGDYEDLVKKCAKIGVKVVASPFMLQGHSGRENSRLVVTEEELLRFYMMGGAVDYDGVISGGRRGDDYICAAGHTTLSINPYGDVFPCNACPDAVGNVRRTSLADIWQNSPGLAKLRRLRFRDISSSCEGCRYSEGCMTCVGAMLRENGGALRPCSVTCRNARIFKHAIQADFVPCRDK